MARLYCTLEEVKRVLRSIGVRESKIRFSNAFKELSNNPDNVGSVSLSGVSFLSSFADHEQFEFTFTDATSFDVVGDVTGTIGSGVRTSEFIATGKFTVPVANWSGGSQSGDIVSITSNSDISDDDGEDFVEDASQKINGSLRKVFGNLSSLSFTDSTSTDVIPDEIQYAAKRLAAYEIFTSVYSGVATEEESPVINWKRMAEESVNDYISSVPKTGPRWRSRDGLITKVGVPGVGEGEIDLEPTTAPTNKDFQR